uniref:Uncharacterized protein n=1 Tax=Acrobeloides nanus TaxID=290746 RepID=A0A914CFY2_9BILA
MPCHCIGAGDLFQYLGNDTLVLYNDFLDAFPIGSKTKLNFFQHLLTLSEDESIAKLEKFGKEYVDESDENTIVIENQPDLKFTSAPIVPIASDKWIILDDNGQMVLGNTTGGSKWKILKPTKETNEQFYKCDGLDNENYRKFYRSGNNIYFLCLKNVDGEPDEVMLYEIKVFEENGTFDFVVDAEADFKPTSTTKFDDADTDAEAKFLDTTKAEALNATPSFIYDIFIHNGVLFYLNEGILLTAFFRPLKQEEKEVLNKH